MVKLTVGKGYSRSRTTYVSGRDDAAWTRPADWLTMPTVSPTEQKVVILFAIKENHHNYITLRYQSHYTVDWGDGTTPQNYNSNAVAEYSYDFTNTVFNGTVTSEGYKQAIITITPQAGQNLTYVTGNVGHSANPTIDSFSFLEIIASLPNATVLQFGGAYYPECKKLTLLSALTSTTVNMSNFASNFFALEDVSVPSTIRPNNLQNAFNQCYMLKEAPAMDTSSCTTFYGTFNTCRSLRAGPDWDTSAGTNFYAMFYYCINLETVPFYDTTNNTSFYRTFFYCEKLRTHHAFNTSNVTTTREMYYYNYELVEAPMMDTSNVTLTYGMFGGCHNLRKVPLYDLSSVTNAYNMFGGCVNLQTLPKFNLSNCTMFNYFVSGCYNLSSFPEIDFSSATDMVRTFSHTFSLQTLPNLNTSNVTTFDNCFTSSKIERITLDMTSATNASHMFYSCQNLREVNITGGTTALTSAYRMFRSCNQLKEVPALNFANVTNMREFVYGCQEIESIGVYNVSSNVTDAYRIVYANGGLLEEIPDWNLSGATILDLAFAYNYSLRRIRATGMAVSFQVIDCNLSDTALEEIFTNCATVSSGTITITNTPGAATCNRTIATNKGWTVVG